MRQMMEMAGDPAEGDEGYQARTDDVAQSDVYVAEGELDEGLSGAPGFASDSFCDPAECDDDVAEGDDDVAVSSILPDEVSIERHK